MSELLAHPKTIQQVTAIVQAQPHAVLMSGPVGSGKKTLAAHLAAQVLKITDVDAYPYYLKIAPAKASIGIEEIRQIRAFLSRKTTGTEEIRRVVLIADAHTMTIEAQNALLKALEEPPIDTMFLLTVSDINRLKATILSRVQHIKVLAVDNQQALHYFVQSGHSAHEITSSYYISGGRAGLLTALLNQNTNHALIEAISYAKELLRMPVYDRLVQVDSLSKQKDKTELVIQGLLRVVNSGLKQSAIKANKSQTEKFHNLSLQLLAAGDALSQNANVKLVLSQLFVQM